jgi:hypothetical protein
MHLDLDVLQTIQAHFGHPARPSHTPQQPVHSGPPDFYRQHLSIADSPISPELLAVFCNDLMNHPDPDPELGRYLLPYCLAGWDQAIRHQDEAYAAISDGLWNGLLPEGTIRPWLTGDEWAALRHFTGNTILQSMTTMPTLRPTRSSSPYFPPYDWIRHLNAHCCSFTNLEPLWHTWWSHPSIGLAYCAIQWASRIILRDEDNRIFNPTPGTLDPGAALLWDTVGLGSGWLPQNALFLKQTLTPEYFAKQFTIMAARVRPVAPNETTLLDLLDQTLHSDQARIALRLAQLPRLLEDPILSYSGWDDAPLEPMA